MSVRSDDRGLSNSIAIAVSAAIGILVAALSVWWAASFNVFYESLFRVRPTVSEGGVGAEWVAGNTLPALDFLIALTHAADVIMGVFILLMVFIHWASFRRLASQMRRPTTEERGSAVVTDGGDRE